MPISTVYVVQYLVEATLSSLDPLSWREEDGGYVAETRGVRIYLETAATRSGERICLTLTYDVEDVFIPEPMHSGIISRRYESNDEERLALLLRQLWTCVVRQCLARQQRSPEVMSRIREAIYGRLVGLAQPEKTRLASG